MSLFADRGFIQFMDIQRMLRTVFPNEIIKMIFDYYKEPLPQNTKLLKSIHYVNPFWHRKILWCLKMQYMQSLDVRPNGTTNVTFACPIRQLKHDQLYMKSCPYQKYKGDCVCNGKYKHDQLPR